MLQIKVGIVRGLHHGIVDIGSLNADPTDKIIVLLVHLAIFIIRRGFGWGVRFLCSCTRSLVGKRLPGGFFVYQTGDTFKGFFTFFFLRIMTVNHNAGEQKEDGEKCRPHYQKYTLHGSNLHIIPV